VGEHLLEMPLDLDQQRIARLCREHSPAHAAKRHHARQPGPRPRVRHRGVAPSTRALDNRCMEPVRAEAKPLVVVEQSERAFAHAVADLRTSGWKVVSGWAVPTVTRRVVCSGVVASAEDAAAALLAALGGVGLVIDARADREVVDRLCDDLRRIGSLDHRVGETERRPALTREEQAIVDLLLEGLSLGEAAQRLHLARRTADRRLASVRHKLGVKTTAAALVEISRPGASASVPRPRTSPG